MTVLLDTPAPAARGGSGEASHSHDPTTARTQAAQRLRHDMAAVRVSFRWLGTRKTLTPEQRAQAAETFDAEGAFLSAGKKLLDSSHPQFRAVTTVRTTTIAYWKGMTLPYPEPGVRLIPRERIEAFHEVMTQHRTDLEQAVEALDAKYADLKQAARSRLGQLFCASDYPESLRPLFGVEWDFPSVEPPAYLRQVSPELYEQERQRIAARFDEAVRLAETAFREEFASLLDHLAERLSGFDDGKAKVFRNSAITNLHEFFGRFGALNVHSDAQLDELVARARRLVDGTQPQDVRTDDALRKRIAEGLGSLRGSLDELLVDKPRRCILRSRSEGAHAAAG